jgi:hypothetical protein
MKNNRNDLNDMLSLVRDYPPAEPILSREDVRRTIEGAEAWQPTITPVRRRITMISIVAGVLAAGAASVIYLSSGSSNPQQPAIADQHQMVKQSTGTSREKEMAASMSPVVAAPAVRVPIRTTPKHTPSSAPTLFSSGNTGNGSSADTVRNSGAADTTDETMDMDTPGVMRITFTENDSADIAHNREREHSADTALNISGIGALELTPQELAQLGIEVTPSGLRVFAEEKYTITDPRTARHLYKLGYDTTQKELVKRYNIDIDTFSVELNTVLNPNQNRYSRIVPIVIYNQNIQSEAKEGTHLSYFNRSPLLTELITNYHGSPDAIEQQVFDLNSPEQIMNMRQGDLQKFPLASKLIPIYIRMGNQPIEGTNRRRGADIYLWYYPTREFIAALPDRYRHTLQEELEVLADVEADRMNSSDACQCLPGGPTVLGICRLSSGAVTSASLFPNPAQNSTTIQYRLTQQRYVTITLNDLSGRYLKTLVSGEELNTGDYHVPLPLNEVQSGTYLVVVRTDRGEQAVQRLIVQ